MRWIARESPEKSRSWQAKADDPQVAAELYEFAGKVSKGGAKTEFRPLRLNRETVRAENVDGAGNCADFGGSSRGVLCED